MPKVILERPDPLGTTFQVKEREGGLVGFIHSLIRWFPEARYSHLFYVTRFPNNKEPTHFLVYSCPTDIYDNASFGRYRELIGIVNVDLGDIESAREKAICKTYELTKAFADERSRKIGCKTSDLADYCQA